MTAWLETWRLRVAVHHGGHLNNAPAGIIKNAMQAQLLGALCPYAAQRWAEPPCGQCMQQDACVYSQVLKPKTASGTLPAGIMLRYQGDWSLCSGAEAFVDVTAVGSARRRLPEVVDAIDHAWQAGIGRRTNRVQGAVIAVQMLPPPRVPTGDRLRVDFVTPLVLRVRRDGQRFELRWLESDPFMDALRMRIAGLGEQFGPPDWTVPDANEMWFSKAECRLEAAHQYSARQGRTLKAKGLVGSARLSGEIAAWRPALACAVRLGVGRLTSWGNGQVRLSAL